ncbi:MAG: MFS transporter [Simkaniaceae bacterium]
MTNLHLPHYRCKIELMKAFRQVLKDQFYYKTRFAILWSNLINEPFASLFTMMPFILRRDLEASAFQIVLFTMLRPVVSVFSYYWSSNLKQQKKQLRPNLLIAGILARLPFLFFPIIHSSWYLIFSGLIYILFTRASVPAWIEILKCNLPKQEREKLFSLGWTLGYLEGICLALGIGAMLDFIASSWTLLFFFSALLGMISTFLQARVPIKGEETFTNEDSYQKNWLTAPLKDSFSLLRERPDFALFQKGFMLGGFGVMLIHPALPLFYIDVLNLSYLDIALALTLCKGLGIVMTSSLWARWLSKYNPNRLAGLICLGFALFPLFLILAPWTLFWVYFAYLVYGIAQGGSHLMWHLSGPLFAQEEESSRYSAVNILMVGIRGLIAPILGGLLSKWFGATPTLIVGALFCSLGAYTLYTENDSRSGILTLRKPTS